IKGNEHSDRLATQAAVDSKQTLS
ncbi:ribonuclease H, partial [Vibrio parahaemolyticus]|nr:ribonuclease H [Vibrio parahaemolyticus]EGR3346192.1 ribonuclease H [Vibrio parahaemolyticus]